MEVNKRASIKSIPYDEFKDNDTLEKIAQELNEGGANVVVGSLDAAINWGRSNSLWSLTFGTSCCGIEFMAVGCARYDFSRFGFEVTRNSPRQADLIMCAGTITNKMAPVFKRLYDEMAEPKYVVAVDGCAISGGPFKKSYNVVLGSLDAAINWGRSNSLWSLTFGTSCCGIEFMAVGCARYDFSRFGFEVTRNSPRQADLIMCAGTITNKMAPVFKRLYDEMAEPKYVVAVGGCTISGGPFKKSYNVVRGISELVPVDVYIPGCPPRPEAILYGMMQLQRKVKVEKFFGGANHKMTRDEKELSMSKGGLRGLSNENLSDSEKLGHKKPIIVTEVPEDFDPQKGLTD